MVAEQLPEASSSHADDDVLLTRARSGDNLAFSVLYVRYHRQARALAARLSSAVDPEDVCAEAFSRVFAAIRHGSGPTSNFGGYLLSAVRTQVADQAVAARREISVERVDDAPVADTEFDPVVTDELRRALAHLPDSWRLVLWKVEVEGLKPRELARSFGVTPAAVSALVYRAREGLREAYLQVQLAPVDRAACRRTSELLAGHVRRNLAAAQQRQVNSHLAGCLGCTQRMDELTDLNRGFDRVGTSRALAAAGPLAVIGSAKLAGWLVGTPAAACLIGPTVGVMGGVVALGQHLATKKAVLTAAGSAAMVGAASAAMIVPLAPHHSPDPGSSAAAPAVTGVAASPPSASDREWVGRTVAREAVADPVARLAPVSRPVSAPAHPSAKSPVKTPTTTPTDAGSKTPAKASTKASTKAPSKTPTKSSATSGTSVQAAVITVPRTASQATATTGKTPVETTGDGRTSRRLAAADVLEAIAGQPVAAKLVPGKPVDAKPVAAALAVAPPAVAQAGASRHRAVTEDVGDLHQSTGRHRSVKATVPASAKTRRHGSAR